MFGVLCAMLASPEVAEEVVQDAFHAVWRAVRSYREERGSVRTWLLAIARNAAIDWRRTRGRREARERPLDEAVDTRVEETLERTLRSANVREALAALPPEQREVLVLAFFSGLSQTEIAARTGVPLGTVKGRARLGMARLRKALAGET